MTDKQLAAVLHQFQWRLDQEIEKLKEGLPYQEGKNILGHYIKYYPELDSLCDFSDELQQQIKLLNQSQKNE